jgi:high-affinity iron transporter
VVDVLPTFVIGLREGLEAALIVGIIAAFLRKQGRRDLLRWVFVGVGTAIALCLAAGIALDVLSKDLPQKQQEGLETVIGALAVGMVTYMVVWMKRNSRGLKGQLEGLTADALGATSAGARAMVAMAFLAVLREGIETVVFLLAAFSQSGSGASAPAGAALGMAVAVALGYGIYRGGVRINLSKFFRATGLVLVLVAGGLLVNALRTAHEAGWIDIGQSRTVDLTWLVDPGSVQASLLTGMLGLQSRPVVIELVGWLLYLVPVGLYVAWPPGRRLSRRTASRVLLATAAVLAVGTALLAVAAPSEPGSAPTTHSRAGDLLASLSGARASLVQRSGDGAPSGSWELSRSGSTVRGGVATDVYVARTRGTGGDLPRTLSYERLAEINGGRLPIGLQPAAGGSVAVRYVDALTTTAWIEPRTARVVDLRSVEVLTATVTGPDGTGYALSRPVSAVTSGLTRAESADAAAAAQRDLRALSRHTLLTGLAWTAGGLFAVVVLVGAALAITPGSRHKAAALPGRSGELIRR